MSLTVDQVAQHNTPDDCWIIVNGKVYDLTNFLDDHPGGRGNLLSFAGKDATKQFNAIHGYGAIDKVKKYYIARLVHGVSKDRNDQGLPPSKLSKAKTSIPPKSAFARIKFATSTAIANSVLSFRGGGTTDKKSG